MTGQANFLQSLGWAVLNSLWQLALLWVLYQVLTGIFKKISPATKSLLAAGLLISGFAWFLYTFITVLIAGPVHTDTITAGIVAASADNELSAWLQQSLPVASVIYLILLLLPVLRFMRNYRYVQVIRQYGRSKLQVDWRMFVQRTAAQMGIRKKVNAWVSELVSSPVTIGFLKPVILVPLAAINHLSPQQLEAVLLHELSHIKRSDYLVNLLINFIQTILYFNPFVKAFVKIVEREREKSCDEMVLQFQYDSHDYASALLTLEKASQVQKPFAMAAAGKKNDLLHRIETIMGVQPKPSLSFNKLAGLFAGLLCIIALNALLIITRPAGGQSPAAFTRLASPLSLFSDEPLTIVSETTPATIENKPEIETSSETTEEYSGTEVPDHAEIEVNIDPIVINPGIINASLDMAMQTPLLNKEQERQVMEAIAASKKVLEEVQWKTVEKEIADVFSRQEKERLKSTYEKELNKMDWKLWETKLRQAYDKVNWEKVNEQLTNAVAMVRMDSLHRVYSDAISKIDMATSEMALYNQSGIPDSDITLKELEQKRQELLNRNQYLKGVKTRKIVRL